MSDAGQEQEKSDDIERARITELKPSGIIKRVLILVAVVGLMMGGITSLGLYWMDKILHQRQSFSGHTFEIEKGDTLKRFTAQLQQAGVVGQQCERPEP